MANKIKYHISIIQQDSRGQDKIIDNAIFENRSDADEFINKYNAEPLPYRTEKEILYYKMRA